MTMPPWPQPKINRRREWHLSKHDPIVRWRFYLHGTEWFDVVWVSYVVLPQ
jgi:hypothetical protein